MIIGKKILRYRSIDSTNDEARRLINKGEGEGLVVVAGEQTKGRGKPGRNWFSPPGNIYLSAVVKPYKNPRNLGPITLLAALASTAMIRKIAKLPATIKWPNDILIHGKKAGGILTERLVSGYVIIGIGINVNSQNKLRKDSTSLRIESEKSFSLSRCIKLLLAALDLEYLAYLAKV